jgi:hypothetical protein
MQKRCFRILLAAALSLPLNAASFVAGTWYHVITNFNADATNGSTGGTGINAYVDPGAAPWSFSLLDAGTLEVVDGQNPGDTIRVENILMDNSRVNLGVTPQGSPFNPGVNCGLEPETCLADNNFARITVALTANTAYNLQFIAIDSPLFSSSAFFRITGTLATNDPPPPPPPPVDPPPPADPPPAGPGAIPEPSTYALSGGAIAALAYLRNRKR